MSVHSPGKGPSNCRTPMVGDGDLAIRLAKLLHSRGERKPEAAARAADFYRIPRQAMSDLLDGSWDCNHI